MTEPRPPRWAYVVVSGLMFVSAVLLVLDVARCTGVLR